MRSASEGLFLSWRTLTAFMLFPPDVGTYCSYIAPYRQWATGFSSSRSSATDGGFRPEAKILASIFALRAWYADYMATYVERDLRQLVNVRNLGAFRRFVRMCAARCSPGGHAGALAAPAPAGAQRRPGSAPALRHAGQARMVDSCHENHH
jgi:hypothetical protein